MAIVVAAAAVVAAAVGGGGLCGLAPSALNTRCVR